MALLRYKDVKNMSDDEKRFKIEELRKELVKQNAQRSTGTPLKSSGRMKEIRKAIARIMTHDNAKRLGIVEKKKETKTPEQKIKTKSKE